MGGEDTFEARMDVIETGVMELGAKIEWLLAYVENLENAIKVFVDDDAQAEQILSITRELAHRHTGGALSG